jgi:beta-aspartyl-peptidase (threonine type)
MRRAPGGSTVRPVTGLFVHGGVSGVEKDVLPDLSSAIAAGSRGATALDIVEAAVRVLEEDPALNAGFGAVLDAAGDVSLDAGIADGTTGSFGAVAGVTVANPISLARRVLASTPHALMIGAGAMALADGLPEVRVARDRRAQWEDAERAGRLGPETYGRPERVDTVGAVAIDDAGGLAAASSTGGVFGKLPGRVGDSPVFGAGFYASPKAAVVGTGVGELFLETLACARVGDLIERGASPQDACDEVIEFLGSRATTSAGLLAIDASGDHGCSYRGGSLSVFGPDGRVVPVRFA